MKCDPNDHCIVLAVDGTVFCKSCPQKWSPEQPSTKPKEPKEKPENVLGPSACCDRDPCKCGKEKYKSFMCRTGEHGQCVKCPCDCHGEKKERYEYGIMDVQRQDFPVRHWMTDQPKEIGWEIRTPFDGEPIKGRVFTKEEVEERVKMFQQLFNL